MGQYFFQVVEPRYFFQMVKPLINNFLSLARPLAAQEGFQNVCRILVHNAENIKPKNI
jgi:hypothetical protein